MNFSEKERILKSVMEQIEPERTARKRAQIKKLSSLAAIAVVVLLLGACAVKVFHLDDKIAAVIGGSTPEIESVAADSDAYDEEEGIRIEGRQIVSDGIVTYISFDVISLTDQTFRYDNTFEDHMVVIDDKYIAWGRIYSISAVSEDGKTMSLVLEIESSKVEGEHNIKVQLSDLIENYTTNKVLVKGSWEIDFDYTCEKIIETYYSGDEIVVDGFTISIDKAEISPLTFRLDVSIPEGSPLPPEDWWGIDTFSKVELLLSDGTTELITDRGAGWSIEGSRQWGNIEGRPANFINVGDVVGISFDGQEVIFK